MLPLNHADWPEVAKQEYEERAGIMEDGISREEAEKLAEENIRHLYR